MKCIQDIECGKFTLVGVKDFVDCPHPSNILYINRLPGIELKTASAIVNDEYRSGISYLKDCIKLAHTQVFHRFSGMVSDKFTFDSYIDSVTVDRFATTEAYSPEVKERGLSLTIGRFKVAKLFIDEVYIRVKESGIAYVTIKDGDTTKVFETSLLANKTMSVPIAYKCESDNVLITFDQTNFSAYKGTVSNSEGCSSCGKHTTQPDILVKGWDGIEETNDLFGMGVLANLQCDEEALICQLLPRMNFMVWYQSGINFMEEFLASGRVNAVVSFGKERAAAILEDLELKLAKEEKEFSDNISQFIKKTAGECFTCKGTQFVYGIPG